MSTQAIKTLFALDDGVEMASMGASLAVTAPLQIVGFVEGLDASWRSLEETSPDLLVVAVSLHI
jgi:hypothetical protein